MAAGKERGAPGKDSDAEGLFLPEEAGETRVARLVRGLVCGRRGAAQTRELPPLPAGHRPHLPPEVPLSPWRPPLLRQAPAAPSYLHRATLRGDRHLPGTGVNW